MICRDEIADAMSALLAARIRDRTKHGILLKGRDGAGDESTGRDLQAMARAITWWQAAEIIGIILTTHFPGVTESDRSCSQKGSPDYLRQPTVVRPSFSAEDYN